MLYYWATNTEKKPLSWKYEHALDLNQMESSSCLTSSLLPTSTMKRHIKSPVNNFFSANLRFVVLSYYCSIFPHLHAEESNILDKPANPTVPIFFTLTALHSLKSNKNVRMSWKCSFRTPGGTKSNWKVNYSSSWTHLNIMQFKELHRNHQSKAKLAKCFPGTDEAHNTCAYVLTHVAHTIW